MYCAGAWIVQDAEGRLGGTSIVGEDVQTSPLSCPQGNGREGPVANCQRCLPAATKCALSTTSAAEFEASTRSDMPKEQISSPPDEHSSRQALLGCGFAAIVVTCLQLL
jgi:hypothetical protein